MIVVVPGGQSEQLRGAPPPVLTLALARLAVVPGPGGAKTFMAGIHLSLALSFLHSVSENFLTTLIQTSQVFSCAATQHVIMYFFCFCFCLFVTSNLTKLKSNLTKPSALPKPNATKMNLTAGGRWECGDV